MFDLIVRGGRVIDPAQDLDSVVDVGIIGRRIASIGQDLIKAGVREGVVDASGLLVTPGWVDLHTHVYWGVAPLGVDADAHCLRRAVTTAVDAWNDQRLASRSKISDIGVASASFKPTGPIPRISSIVLTTLTVV